MMSRRQGWAKVLELERMHGHDALPVIDEAISDLLAAGEVGAVAHLLAVAAKVEQLRRPALLS